MIGPGAVIIQQTSNNHAMPALLSFFLPGLGQIIKGEVGRGIAIFVVWGITVVASMFIFGIPFMIGIWV